MRESLVRGVIRTFNPTGPPFPPPFFVALPARVPNARAASEATHSGNPARAFTPVGGAELSAEVKALT